MSVVSFTQGAGVHADSPLDPQTASLYEDVKNPKVFLRNENEWIAQAPRSDYQTPSFGLGFFIPGGLTKDFVWGFSVLAPQSTMHESQEISDFAQRWLCTLYRCRYRPQYDGQHRWYLEQVETHPHLKPAAEIVLRSKELIEFRDALPSEGSGHMDGEIAKRECGIYTCVVRTTEEEPILNGLQSRARIYVLRYRTKKIWKETKISISFVQGTRPSGYFEDGIFYLAYYISESTVRMEAIDLNGGKRVSFFEVHSSRSTALICEKNLFSDGYRLYDQTSTHEIEGEEITAIRRHVRDELLIGTNKGHLYMIKANRVIATRDPLPIRCIGVSGLTKMVLQSQGEVFSGNHVFQLVRPICSTIKGDGVYVLSSTGTITISFLHSGETVYFPAKEPIQGTHWYQEGFYIEEDGEGFAVMHPDGSVRILRLKREK